jgi:hypothetical protein
MLQKLFAPNLDKMFISVRQDEVELFVVRPNPKGRTGFIVNETEFFILKLLAPFVNLFGFLVFCLMLLLLLANIFELFRAAFEGVGWFNGKFYFYTLVLVYTTIMCLTGLLPRLFITVTLADKPKISLDDVEVIATG